MKSGMLDLAVIGYLAMAFAIVLIILTYTYGEYSNALTDTLENSTLNYTLPNVQKVDAVAQKTFTFYDTLFLVFVIGLVIMSLWGAYNINTHPSFFIISMFTFLIVLFIIWVFQYTFAEFAGFSMLASASNRLPIINYFMNNLPLIVSVYFILLTIVTYTTRRRNDAIVSPY